MHLAMQYYLVFFSIATHLLELAILMILVKILV